MPTDRNAREPRRLMLALGVVGAVVAGALAVADGPSSADLAGPPSPARSRLRACHIGREGLSDALQPEPSFDGCFVRVPAATVLLGAQRDAPGAPGYDPLAADDEGPPRLTTLDAFWILVEEVTTAQFTRCVEAGGCRREDVSQEQGYFHFGRPSRGTYPVNGVTWRGASDYCRWVGARLPTEAEWEYAARGPGSLRYPWGHYPATCDNAVMSGADGPSCGEPGPREVRYHPPRPGDGLRLQHLSGNVWEWVADWYTADPARRGPATNPRGPATGTRRVQRGGSWLSADPAELRGAFRASMEPDAMLDDVGFRCAADEVAAKFDRAMHPTLGPIAPQPVPSQWAGAWSLRLLFDNRVRHSARLQIDPDGRFSLNGTVFGVARADGALFFTVTEDATFVGAGDGRCASADHCEGHHEIAGEAGTFDLRRSDAAANDGGH
jgi:formylglycine-generating enzyme required for sulfatase activity